MERVLVTGAGGFIGHHLVTYLKDPRLLGPRRRPQGARVHRRSTPTSSSCSTCAAGTPAVQASRRDRPGLRPGRRHGRHGLHLRPPRRDPAQQRADQPAHARGRPPDTASSATSTARRPASTPSTCQTDADVTPLREEDAYPAQPQDAYGWEKLITEKLCEYYADELRDGDADRALPQHLRAATAPTTAAARRRRPRCAARSPWPTTGGDDRDLGRRRADPLVLLHRRLRRGHLPADAVRLPRAAQPRHRPHGHDQRAGPDHHRDLRQAGIDHAPRRRARRACAAATPTTPGCARCSAGSPASRSRRGCARPTAGSRSRWAPPEPGSGWRPIRSVRSAQVPAASSRYTPPNSSSSTSVNCDSTLSPKPTRAR